MIKRLSFFLALAMLVTLASCGKTPDVDAGNVAKEPTTLVYGSGDYTRINPALDEHCEINVLLFNG